MEVTNTLEFLTFLIFIFYRIVINVFRKYNDLN